MLPRASLLFLLMLPLGCDSEPLDRALTAGPAVATEAPAEARYELKELWKLKSDELPAGWGTDATGNLLRYIAGDAVFELDLAGKRANAALAAGQVATLVDRSGNKVKAAIARLSEKLDRALVYPEDRMGTRLGSFGLNRGEQFGGYLPVPPGGDFRISADGTEGLVVRIATPDLSLGLNDLDAGIIPRPLTSSSGQMILDVTGDLDNAVTLMWDPTARHATHVGLHGFTGDEYFERVKTAPDAPMLVTAAMLSRDGKSLYVCVGGNRKDLRRVNLARDDRFAWPAGWDDAVSPNMAASPSGAWLAVATTLFGSGDKVSGEIAVFETASGKQVANVALPGGGGGAIRFTAEDRLLVQSASQFVEYQLASARGL